MAHTAPILITPYSAQWPALFRSEQQHLGRLFADVAHVIEHIGSTAVPGLSAKPIIDIMLGLDSLQHVDMFKSRLGEFEYDYRPEHEVQLPDRRFFAKPFSRPRIYHLHIVLHQGRFWKEHIIFRDALRKNKALAGQYQKLKYRLASELLDNRTAYTDSKTQFIRDVIRLYQ